jgi:hypothetical protein
MRIFPQSLSKVGCARERRKGEVSDEFVNLVFLEWIMDGDRKTQ